MVEGMGMKVWGEGSAVQSGEIYRRNIAGGSEWASRNATQRKWVDRWMACVCECYAMRCHAMLCGFHKYSKCFRVAYSCSYVVQEYLVG
jgi:hypothetical protein